MMTEMVHKTLLIELRFQEDTDSSFPPDVLATLDDLNDCFVDLAIQMEMDILSISHSHHFYQNAVQFSSTGVFLHDGRSIDLIVQYISDVRGEYAYAFEDRGKVSVVLSRRPGGRL